MSWNPQPALGGALWQGNQTLATVRQLNSTTQSLISSIEALSTTGDYQFDILKASTLFVSTITSIDGKSALRITNLSSIRISTFGNYLQDSDNIQTTAKANHYNFLNGTYTNRNFDTVNNLYDPLTNKTDILTGTGSFQALTGSMTIAATNSTLNLYAGDVINMTGKVNANSNDFTNIKGLSSISVSTGTLIAGAATLNGNLDMNGNSISAANVITTNTLSASLVGATSGNFTNISGSLQGNVTGNIYNQNLTVGAKYSINETVDVGSAVGDYGSYGTLNLNAKGGLGGIVNITADVATPINPAVTVSQLTAEAKGNYGLITPGTPVGYIPRGGLVSIIARQGLTPSPPAEVTSALFANGEIDLTAYSYGTVPGLIKMSAGANFMYAGTITPLTGIYGNNYIYGQYANSITAGLPSGGLPNTPGTNYIYGYNGTIVENGLYVDTVYNKFGGDLSLNARTSNLNLNGATVQAQTNVVGQGHGLFDFANITGVNYDISINASGGHVVNLSNVNNFFGSNIRVSSLSTFNLLASNAFINYMQIQNLSTNNMVVSTVTTGDITGLPGTATATTVSFVYTGGNQTWTAPAGCYYIDITLNGACGGNFSGLGGKVSGRLNVNPGQVYTIIVGGGGQNTTPGPATYGGGGAGNYSGGGRTAIAYAGADLATAGGGGGNPYYSGFTGGNGGGLTGAAGTGTGADGGLGGSQTAGGSGGVDSNPGGNGSQYQGGTGSGYGGGGGGGYFGGGGGADSGNPPAFLSGGGGGGSSYVANLYYNVVNTQGGGATTGRNGTASITYYVGNDTVLTLDAQQTNITGNAFIDGDVTGVNTLTATAITTNTIQSLNPVTISTPSLSLSCTQSTTGAFTVNGRGMRNFEFGISQTWSANQLNGVKTVTDANGARYHPSQWVMNHALLGVYEFAGINTASALNYIQTYATTDTNGYLALQWQIFANVDRSGNNGVIKWNLTMIPLEMTQALAPNQVSAGAVVPVALSTVLYTYPNTFASTIIASTLSIKASENLALIANLPYPTFLGVGTVAINANTNVDLMANVDITLGAAHDINATATSTIKLAAPIIRLDRTGGGSLILDTNIDLNCATGRFLTLGNYGGSIFQIQSGGAQVLTTPTGQDMTLTAGGNLVLATANQTYFNNGGFVQFNVDHIYMYRGYLNMNQNPIYIYGDQYHILAYGASGTYNCGTNGPYLAGYTAGALGTTGTVFNDKSLEWNYGNIIAYKPLNMCNNNISNVGTLNVNGGSITTLPGGIVGNINVINQNVSSIGESGSKITLAIGGSGAFGGAIFGGIKQGYYGFLSFETNSGSGSMTEQMRILGNNGNVGINTTTPTEKLDVNGNAVIRGYLNFPSGGSAGIVLNAHPIDMGNGSIYNAGELYNNNTDLYLTGVGRNIILRATSGGTSINLTSPSINITGNVGIVSGNLYMNNNNIEQIASLYFQNSAYIDGAYSNQFNFHASNSYYFGNLRFYGSGLTLDIASNTITNVQAIFFLGGVINTGSNFLDIVGNGPGNYTSLKSGGSYYTIDTAGTCIMYSSNVAGVRANNNVYIQSDTSYVELIANGGTGNIYHTAGYIEFRGNAGFTSSNSYIGGLGHIYGNTASPGGGLTIDYMYGLFFNSGSNNANLYAYGGNLNMNNYNGGTYIGVYSPAGAGALSLYSASNDMYIATGSSNTININAGQNIGLNAANPGGVVGIYTSTMNVTTKLDTNFTIGQNFNVTATGSAQLRASYFNFFNDCYFNNTSLHDMQNIYFGYGPYINRNIPGGYTNAFLDIIGAGGDGQLRLINGSSEVALRANSDLGITPTSGHNIVLNGPISASSNLNMNYHDITNLSYVSGSNIVIQDLGGNLDLLSYRVALPSGFLDLPATDSKIDFNGYCYISRDYGTSNFNIKASRNLSILASTVTRNLGTTEVIQPVIQYGIATGSGASGSVSVTIPTTYTSTSSYVVQVTMRDSPPAELYATPTSANTFTIGWSSAGGGTQNIMWTTFGS